jgi:hypothetical protein
LPSPASDSGAPHRAAHDDPASCVDYSPANAEWKAKVSEQVGKALAKGAACTHTLSGTAYASLDFSFRQNGSLEHVVVTRSTTNDCKALACLRRALNDLRVPAPAPTVESLSFETDVRLPPHAAPQLIDQADFESESTSCVDQSAPRTQGRLPPEQIQSIIRSNYDKMRDCYATGLGRDPRLTGRVTLRFVIGRDGGVSKATVFENTLPDCQVASCVRDVMKSLAFPVPEGGIVTVIYPIMLEPG